MNPPPRARDEHALARNHVTPDLQREAKRGDLWYVKLGAWRWVIGLPDYALCVRGRFVAIELKHPSDLGSKASARQRRVMLAISRAGGFAAVCRTREEVALIVADARAGARSEAAAHLYIEATIAQTSK